MLFTPNRAAVNAADSLAEVVAAVRDVELASAIESGDEIISFPGEASRSPSASLLSDFAAMPVGDGARETIEGFRNLLVHGLVAASA